MLGTSLVYAAGLRYSSTLQGPALTASDFSVKQGLHWAFERFVVTNIGTSTASSLFVASSGVAPGTTYCFVVSNASSSAVLVSTCPTMVVIPAYASIAVTLRPGTSAVVVFTMEGGAFAVGSWVTLVVGAANGAQVSLSTQVVPA